MSTPSSPGRLLRYTLSIHRNKDKPSDEAEKFARDYVKKIAPLHARHGIEMYQTIYSPLAYRTALDSMNRRDGRGFTVDVSNFEPLIPSAGFTEEYEDKHTPGAENELTQTTNFQDHDVTVEFYFRSFAELSRVTSDPKFREFQAAEAPYVDLVRAVVSLGWVETYVEGGRVVNLREGEDGGAASAYPSWAELGDLSTAFPPKEEGQGEGEGGKGGRTKWSAE